MLNTETPGTFVLNVVNFSMGWQMGKIILIVVLYSGALIAGADDGQNYDRGPDCGGCDANAGRCDWTWGPSDGGCHGPVVGSPGANGMVRMIDYYPAGANGPSEFLSR